MKKYKFNLLQKLIIIFAILCMAFVAGYSSYAAYTSVKTAKRVVSTVPSADTLFSSNYLSLMQKANMSSSTYKTTSVEFSKENTDPTIHISVCNYAQGYITKWCETEIAYDIKFTLVDTEGDKIGKDKSYDIVGTDGVIVKTVSGQDILADASYKVAIDGTSFFGFQQDGTLLMGNQKISPDEAGRHIYSVMISPDYQEIVGIMVEVKTTEGSTYENLGLGGILRSDYYSNQVANGWSGEFVDPKHGYNDPRELSGFNYEITGNGEGVYTLEWDSSKISISGIFLNEISDYRVDDGSNDNMVSFKVGTSGQQNLYSVQFYRMQPVGDAESWNVITGWVTISKFQE